METLATLFLYSAQKYSSLADEIFGDSVEKSQFASTISNQRMQVAKNITGTPLDIKIELGDEDMEIFAAEEGWQNCLALDNILMREMAHDEAQFLPLLAGVFVSAHQGVAYLSKADDRPKYKQCLGCGAITETWQCPVCLNEKNWLVGVEVPENTVETEQIFDINKISFGDFPPERPVQPKKWEVLFDIQEDDIFTATGLSKPLLTK